MSNDLSIRGLRRVPDLTESNTQSAHNKKEGQAVNSQPTAAPPKPDFANARKAEADMTAGQLQSQLLNQTSKTISTGTNRVTNQQTSKPDGAALQKALKMYGITNDQLQRYVATGEEPDALKKAINDARTKGNWPAVNLVRASFQMRAEYLRANSSPNDKEIRAHADQLDAEVGSLTQSRHEIQLKGAKDRLEISKKYDHAARPTNIQKQVEQASKEIENLSSEIETKIKPRK